MVHRTTYLDNGERFKIEHTVIKEARAEADMTIQAGCTVEEDDGSFTYYPAHRILRVEVKEVVVV